MMAIPAVYPGRIMPHRAYGACTFPLIISHGPEALGRTTCSTAFVGLPLSFWTVTVQSLLHLWMEADSVRLTQFRKLLCCGAIAIQYQ